MKNSPYVAIFAVFVFVQSRPIPSPVLDNEELFEQDIIHPDKARGAFSSPVFTSLWPNGEVPYMIDPSGNYSQSDLDTIEISLRYMEEATKIDGSKILNFIKLDPAAAESSLPETYVKVIRNGDFCSSLVGKYSIKAQPLSLGYGCVYVGIIVHEFLHALGWWHEHSHPDRDNYIKIQYENILKGFESNFVKYASDQVGTFKFPYDYASVMHYGPKTFSANELDTIVPLMDGVQIGGRDELSVQDIAEIREVYGGNARKSTRITGRLI